MRRFILAVAVLALAGAAMAQDRGGSGLGADIPQPYAPPLGPDLSSPYVTKRQSAVTAEAVKDFQQACRADHDTLCGDKKSAQAGTRCLVYYRLKLSSPCKQAMTKLDLAQRGAL